MEEVYLDILEILANHALNGDAVKRGQISDILVCLNSEGAPAVSDDLADLLTEFYIFVEFGYNPERVDRENAIRDWSDFQSRLRRLEQQVKKA